MVVLGQGFCAVISNFCIHCCLSDLESFLGPMTMEHDEQNQVSLVLFYAVMCSVAAHVDIQVLQSLGYQTRKNARVSFTPPAAQPTDRD